MPIVNVMKEKELKNAYIGEVYEYSYDFRNKTLAQIQADGFSVWEWTTKFSSNWIWCNTTNRIIVNKSFPSLANANKITITQTSIVSNWSCAIALNWTWRSYTTRIYLDSSQNHQQLYIWWTYYMYSWLSAWTYTQTGVFDLVNKTATLSCTWKSDHTETITDTEVSNIRNYLNNIEVYVSNNANYISTFSITVE